MRIVAGKWRGRRIKAPPDLSVRPTADRVREAWMSIVGPALPDARVVDLFAGSGALGLEALSRGAAHADFVEKDPRSLRVLRENADRLDAGEAIGVFRQDVFRFLADLGDARYDIAFVDPPYDLGLAERVAEYWASHPFARII